MDSRKMTSQKIVLITVIVLCMVTAAVTAVFTIGDHYSSNDSQESPREHLLNDTSTQTFPPSTPALAEQNNHTDDQLLLQQTPSPDLIPATIRTHKIRHMKHKIRKEIEEDRKSVLINKDKKAKPKRTILQRVGENRRSCPVRTDYVFMKTAEDVFGDTVDIYPVIHTGKFVIDQHFYESYCDVEKCKCVGVDNEKFESSCQTTHTHVYARIVKGGEIGWSLIKIRSGCSCSVREKMKEKRYSIADLLNK